MTSLRAQLEATLGKGPLLAGFQQLADPFLQRRSKDAAAARLEERVLEGLARLLATSREAGRYLSIRPALLERIADSGPGALAGFADRISETPLEGPPEDLEGFLDELRLLRRDADVHAACLELGGLASFEEASTFLSRVAEEVVRRALAAAQLGLRRAASDTDPDVSIVAMGKLAGRELTYHSDLDLIFLYSGDPERVTTASRVAQRVISYLGTMTGAGVAYAVDARLRPSGRQGALVTSLDAFEKYQIESAATWEHLALMRSRAIAGDVERTQAHLDRVRLGALAASPSPWPEVADMRRRVEHERGAVDSKQVPIKTGSGGLMDIDFLAAGGLLERGRDLEELPWPSVPSMLRAVADGARVAKLCETYAFLRRVEARARWAAGRPVEVIDPRGDAFAELAELCEPRSAPESIRGRIEETRGFVRAAYRSVVERGTIRALEG